VSTYLHRDIPFPGYRPEHSNTTLAKLYDHTYFSMPETADITLKEYPKRIVLQKERIDFSEQMICGIRFQMHCHVK
jgi:hypothetical protein